MKGPDPGCRVICASEYPSAGQPNLVVFKIQFFVMHGSFLIFIHLGQNLPHELPARKGRAARGEVRKPWVDLMEGIGRG